MPRDKDSEPLFDEKEIGAILKRAGEIQGSQRKPVTFGLSMAELQQLATEADIDPAHVAMAVAEMKQSAAVKEERKWWGGPLSFSVQRVISGEINEETWEAMVPEFRAVFNDSGTVRTWGQSMEWTHSGKSGVQAHITLTPRDGRTRVQVFWNETIATIPLFIIPLALSIIFLPITFEALALGAFPGIPFYLGMVGLFFMLARWITSRVSRQKQEALQKLMGTIESLVGETALPETAESMREPQSPLVALDEPAAESSEEEGTRKRSTARTR